MVRLLLVFLLGFTQIASSQAPIVYHGRIVILESGVVPTIQGNFSFPISSTAITSAGVFKNGVLVRTLWNNVSYTAGTYTKHWDGLDDDGATVLGTVEIKVYKNNVDYEWEGVLGNTSSPATGSTIIHGYDNIRSMAYANNYLYVAGGYNEAAGTKYKIPVSAPTSKVWILPSGQGSTQETRHVATDGTNAYWAEFNPNTDSLTFWIHGTSIATDASINFSAGYPYNNTTTIDYPSIIGRSTDSIKGLAANNDFIFACRTSTLQVYTKSTGALVQTLSFSHPRQIVAEGSAVWMITGASTVSKYSVNVDGSLSAATLTLSGLAEPLALATNGSIISVTDGSTSQQVKHYNSGTAAATTSIGVLGGYATSSTVANNKFYFSRPYLCYQGDDNSLWVGDAGNARNQHFSSSNTYIDNIAYLPTTYIITVDENDPTRVFAGFLEFSVDYDDPLASSTLSRNWTYTSPVDNSIFYSLQTVVTTGGRTFGTINRGNTEIVELVSGGNMRLTGVTYNSDYLLTKNMSLTKQWKSDFALGYTVWVNRPYTGLDGSNNPTWGSEVELDRSPFVGFDNTTDGNILPAWRGNGQEYKPAEVTTSGVRPNFYGGIQMANSNSYHLGGVKDGAFLFKTAKSTHREYIGTYPTDGMFDIGNYSGRVDAFAGTNAIAIENNIFWGNHGEFWKGGQTNIWNHLLDNGLMVGMFGTSTGSYQEGYPEMAGNGFATQIRKVGSDYYLYHNDESYFSGIHRWKISNLSSIEEVTVTYPTSNAVAAPTYTDLMAGLPFNSTLPNSLGWTRTTPNANFSAYTSKFTYDKSVGRDVYMAFSEGSGTKVVTKVLGHTVPASTWTLSGQITWNNTTPNYLLGGGGVFLDVLDHTGKKITTFFYHTSYGADEDGHFQGNDVEVFADDLNNLDFGLVANLQDFSINLTSGSFTFSYAGHQSSTSNVAEVGADKTRPTTLQIRFLEDASVHYDKAFDISNFRIE